MSRVPNVLSIAGSDPAGAAGLQADLKTCAAFGVFGCAAVSAVTAQFHHGVGHVLPLSADLVARQLDAVFANVAVDAVKIGMLGDPDVVLAVTTSLRARWPMPTVLDPVLRASSGTSLAAPGTLQAILQELLPITTLVTPNALEVARLLDVPVPRSLDDMRRAAKALVSSGATWGLVKGGHIALGDVCVDVLSNGREIFELRVARIAGGERRGTGCTLASAVAALLARGWDVPDACGEAQRYVAAMIAHTDDARAARIGGALLHGPWTPALEVA
jgi:hydroxymethylpyrimidine/phosphomethylpyrimidine kinase